MFTKEHSCGATRIIQDPSPPFTDVRNGRQSSTINGRHPKPQGCKRKLRPSTLVVKRRRDETGNEIKSAEYEEYSDGDDGDSSGMALVVFLNEVSFLVDLSGVE